MDAVDPVPDSRPEVPGRGCLFRKGPRVLNQVLNLCQLFSACFTSLKMCFNSLSPLLIKQPVEIVIQQAPDLMAFHFLKLSLKCFLAR